ncbi:hypothetical protein [Nocardia sp. NPDC049707]|uniref:hypothetical protein n=1 Tax=Nocardia sp. NPDC049707 TaxID=3154735 RepID=UPI00344095AC
MNTDTAAILRKHVPETITQGDGDGVLVDCACGAEIKGVMPRHIESAVGAVLYVMADHLSEVMP